MKNKIILLIILLFSPNVIPLQEALSQTHRYDDRRQDEMYDYDPYYERNYSSDETPFDNPLVLIGFIAFWIVAIYVIIQIAR